MRNKGRGATFGVLMESDYSTVTERPGTKASREQLAMLYTRYYIASTFCEGKGVLEVGCGAGSGLAYLAGKAKKVIGGDCTERLIKLAQEGNKGRVGLLRLDAHSLPFKDNRFDVVILFEVIYYLARPDIFLLECQRVLRRNGILLICTANKDWYGFNISPFSVSYFSAPELLALLRQQHFNAELFGAFPVAPKTAKEKIIAALRRMAVTLHLIPTTIEGKEILKRLFYGKLLVLPAEISDGMAGAYPLVPIAADSPNSQYKVLYAIAHAHQ